MGLPPEGKKKDVDQAARFLEKAAERPGGADRQIEGRHRPRAAELNKLWSDFYIKNIPAEQDAIKVQISQLTNQIEQKKLFLSEAEAQLEELFEKARKAGVPPGWLR